MTGCLCPNGQGWADDAVTLNWNRLTATIPEKYLPVASGQGGITHRPVYQDYGCGNYGCVYPTSDPSIVFKITTDESEVEFIGLNSQLQAPAGVVKYYGVWRLEGSSGRSTLKSKRDRMYAIVREAADGIGSLREPSNRPLSAAEDAAPEDLAPFLVLLRTFKEAASALRKLILTSDFPSTFVDFAIAYSQEHQVQPAQIQTVQNLVHAMRRGESVEGWNLQQKEIDRVRQGKSRPDELVVRVVESQSALGQGASLLALLDDVAVRMGTGTVGKYVGQALRAYLLRDMLLADVHFKNVGLVKRQGKLVWAITDPGHLVRLSDRLPDVQVAWLQG